MQLVIPDCLVTRTEKAARIDYMGGSLWVPADAAENLISGKRPSIALDVDLRPISTPNGVYTTIRVRKVAK